MRIRCLVEASWGMGDVLEATPLCHALWLLGFDVDLFLNCPSSAKALAPLFEGEPMIRRVFEDAEAIDFASYDFAICAFGDRLALQRMAPGLCRDIGFRDVLRDGIWVANLAPARELGYGGPMPPSIAGAGEAQRDLPPRSVVVHAGCDPLNSAKRWPYWADVCARLEAKGFHVIVIGTEVDRSATRWEDRHDCRFGLPLRDVVALLAHAHAYLGNDSGIGHLAAAAGTPGVLAFGPSDPFTHAPNSTALRIVVAPAREGEERGGRSARRVPIERLDPETVWLEVEAAVNDPRREPPRALPARRSVARGDIDAELPGAHEIAAVPPTLQATDELLRRVWSTAVLGLVARRADASATRAWKSDIALAAGLANLRAAEARRCDRTWRSHRKALRNLYLAWRAGWRVRSLVAGVALVATHRSRGTMWTDPQRD